MPIHCGSDLQLIQTESVMTDKSNFNDYISLYAYTIENHMKLTREHVFILVIIAATLIIIKVAPYLILH